MLTATRDQTNEIGQKRIEFQIIANTRGYHCPVVEMDHSEERVPWPDCSSRSRSPGQTAATGRVEGLCSQRQRSCCAVQNQLQVSLRGLPGNFPEVRVWEILDTIFSEASDRKVALVTQAVGTPRSVQLLDATIMLCSAPLAPSVEKPKPGARG